MKRRYGNPGRIDLIALAARPADLPSDRMVALAAVAVVLVFAFGLLMLCEAAFVFGRHMATAAILGGR